MSTSSTSHAERHALVADLYERSRHRLLRVARRVSLCGEDAGDALQRGFEIALTRAPVTDCINLLPWMTSVVRYEALLIRRRRLRCLAYAVPPSDGIALQPDNEGDPEQRAYEREWARERIIELSRLRPDQRRALTLQAHGYTYREIATLTGWTYTKVNRCITEGRASLIRGR